MAKKKTDETELESTDAISIIEKQINKEYGGAMISAANLLDQPQTIIPWSTSLNTILSGGVPQASAVSVSGKYKTGKTTGILTLAAQAQKLGMVVVYCDVEHRLKEKHLKGIKGLDLSPDKFRIIHSTKEKILTGEDFLRSAEVVLKTQEKCFLIMDSFSALIDSKCLANGVGVETRSGTAKIVSQFVNNNSSTFRVMNSVLVGVNHLIANPSGYGLPFQEKSSNRWLFESDIRLLLKTSKPWINSDKREIGKEIEWVCQESSIGPPGLTMKGYLRYGIGLDSLKEDIEAAISIGAISLAGSWYKLDFLKKEDLVGTNHEDKEEAKFQGEDKLYQAFIDIPNWSQKLNEYVSKFMSSLVGGSDSE